MIKYRRIQKRDIKQIQKVALKVWSYTYRHIYSPSVIKKYVSDYYSDKSLQRMFYQIRKGNDAFYVAVDNRKTVGYSHVGKAKFGWELHRIYLLPRYIGKGIGKKLLQQGERFLKSKKAKQYFVLVHPKNRLGIKFYLRNGFAKFKKKGSSIYLKKKL